MDDAGRFKVVINHEEQYSIWPEEREAPKGWEQVGVSGDRTACLDHIENVWKDMRPLSLRKWMAENPDDDQHGQDVPSPTPRDLADYLASKDHEVKMIIRGGDACQRLAGIVELGYVQIMFTGTEGETELTVEIDPARSDFGAIKGSDTEITVVGNLELDYRPAECHAKIDLSTLTGTGRLKLL